AGAGGGPPSWRSPVLERSCWPGSSAAMTARASRPIRKDHFRASRPTEHRQPYREDTMSYTGNVTVGGPAQSRELPGLTITKVAVGPMDNNAYLLRCTSTGDLLLIDAANEPETLLKLIGT